MKKTPLELGRRERQLVETVAKLGEASVADVLGGLQDPPSYSSVRKMLGILVDKGWLKVRRDGKRYLYRLAESQEKTRRNVVRKMLTTFFSGSPSDALASLLDTSRDRLNREELERMEQLIKAAKRKTK